MGTATNSNSFPLTRSQRLIWTSERLIREAKVNNMAFRFDIFQDLEKATFIHSFQLLVDQADCMRMKYFLAPGKEVPELIVEPGLKYVLPFVDLRYEPDPERACSDQVKSLTSQNFIASELLFRACLYRLDEKHYVLYLSQHHFITDGWSIRLQIDWLYNCYQQLLADKGATGNFEALGSFASHLLNKSQQKSSEKLQKAQRYWQNKSEEMVPPPKFLGRTNTLLEPTSNSIRRKLSTQKVVELKQALQTEGVRSFSTDLSIVTLMSTVCYAFAFQISGQSDLCLGMPFHGRMTATEKETAGVFMELFPTSVKVEPRETFQSLLKKVRASFFELLRYAEPGSGADSVAQSCNFYFNYVNAVLHQGEGFAEKVSWLHSGVTEPTHHFIVKLYNFEGEDKYSLQFDLNEAIFPPTIQETIVDQFLDCLQQCLVDRSQEIGTATPELLTKLKGFHNFETDLPRSKTDTVLSRFKHFVKTKPDAVAFLYEGQSITYLELDRRSNQMARALQLYGLEDEGVVGLCIRRSFLEQIVMLAILKAGGAFLPIDPEYPQSRIDFLLQDSQAKIVIHEINGQDEISTELTVALDINVLDIESGKYSEEAFEKEISSDRLFHIYYTSGSTGKPKGVLVRHDGVLNCLLGMQHAFPISSKDTLVRKTVLSFDSAVWESYWPLITGSKAVIAKHNYQGDTDYLDELMQNNGVTVAYFVAPLLDKYIKEGGSFLNISRVISGGDKLKASVVEHFQEKFSDIQLYNYYGPTEGSIGCSVWRMPQNYIAANPIPIGKPFPGVEIFILNSENKHCLIGMPGELCIGGVQVAAGYLNRPELTADKFVTLPIDGAIEEQYIYRTGDLASWTPAGDIEYLGRIDNQVKIRGVRIELGELEYTLRAANGIVDCAVIAKVLDGEDEEIIAYIVTDDQYNREQIWAYFAKELPVYLIPAHVVEIEEIPLMANGKLDHKSLPSPNGLNIVGNEKPTTEFEAIIYDEWKTIFQTEDFGINANFFGMGGHSLMGIRLINRLNDAFELDMAASMIFRYPTISSLALQVESTILALLAEMDTD